MAFRQGHPFCYDDSVAGLSMKPSETVKIELGLHLVQTCRREIPAHEGKNWGIWDIDVIKPEGVSEMPLGAAFSRKSNWKD